jgi:hypothetical protein
MGKTIMGAAGVSLDGFIADDHDDPGPLFDWLANGDVAWSFPAPTASPGPRRRRLPPAADGLRVRRHRTAIGPAYVGIRSR